MSNRLNEQIDKAADSVIKFGNICALTGAGISVESGIPPFRGQGGIWDKFDPFEYAHIDSFMKNPAKVWDVLLKEMKQTLDKAKPSKAHMALVDLESLGLLKTVITQNIDGLHQASGSNDVIEFHGNFANLSCLSCDKAFKMSEIDIRSMPPKCSCGGYIRPNCVFFGENIPFEALQRSHEAAVSCKIMLVIGTSATVQPAASIPITAKKSGAIIIEINPEKTALSSGISDIFIQGRASIIMTDLLKAIKL
ncbi:SIR2 family NAD-dependent protein deacylase [Desulforegula conservatrix]|uniref:SIR2 family NAD-dependent protein deacylase n=1 Tax=Desulforegula conservatrix TaxID=153026 RepID=UPI0004044263|nr:NAD-dependent deacylase [Desulforegula conservatrix]